MVNFLITCLVAVSFARLAQKINIPAAALLGSIFGVTLLSLFTDFAYFPREIKIFSTGLIGAYIGCRIYREDLRQIRTIGRPVAFMVLAMFTYNLLMSLFLQRITSLDFKTAFLAMAPGGIVDMSLVALDLGAKAPAVSAIQMLRLITVVALTPFAIKGNLARFRKKGFSHASLYGAGGSGEEGLAPIMAGSDSRRLNKLAWTVIVGLSSGILGVFSGFPAGNLIFAILGVGILNMTKGAYLSVPVRKFAQILSGALIGTQVSLGDVSVIAEALGPILLAVGGWVAVNQLLGVLLFRWGGIPLITALFASAAGGMTDMGVIAAEMGGDSLIITSFQFARLLSVLLFYPVIIYFLMQWGLV